MGFGQAFLQYAKDYVQATFSYDEWANLEDITENFSNTSLCFISSVL